jgi:hypothetical protein
MTARDHMERVASLPCLICKFCLGQERYGVQVHHAGEHTERDDWAVVPLCPDHHQGSEGVHGLHRRGFERRWKVSDVKLLAWTNKLLAK